MDWQTRGRADRKTDRQTDRPIDGQNDGQPDRETCRLGRRQKDIQGQKD